MTRSGYVDTRPPYTVITRPSFYTSPDELGTFVWSEGVSDLVRYADVTSSLYDCSTTGNRAAGGDTRADVEQGFYPLSWLAEGRQDGRREGGRAGASHCTYVWPAKISRAAESLGRPTPSTKQTTVGGRKKAQPLPLLPGKPAERGLCALQAQVGNHVPFLSRHVCLSMSEYV